MPILRTFFRSNVTNPNAHYVGPEPDTVWEILSAALALSQDNTVIGSRNLLIKIQTPNYGNLSSGILCSVGNDLTSAGTGTTSFYSWGAPLGIIPGSVVPSAATGISGSLSYLLSYTGRVLVVPGFIIATQGGFLGADSATIYISYLQLTVKDAFGGP